MKGVTEHLSQWLIGKDPMQVGRLWQEMYRSAYFEGGRVVTAAISAIDIALHDIIGRKLGVPVYQLLGGKQRDYVQCFATTGGKTGEEMIENAQGLVADGWECMRLSVQAPVEGYDAATFEPRMNIADNAKWLVKARETLGEEVVIGIDYHHRLSVAETASFC